MIKINNIIIATSMLLLILVSCDNNVIFSESKNIESGIWNINEGVEFDANIDDITTFFNFYIEIDINEDFLTNNLWLFISTQSPSGNIQSDTLVYYIADETGKWFGNKRGEIIKNKFLYKSNIRFPEKGIYNFKILHGMRENDLPEISKIGIRIEEISSE